MKSETRTPKSEASPKPEIRNRPRRSRAEGVAQIFNLSYRRLAVGKPREFARPWARSADPQNAILRYSRVQLCATAERRALWRLATDNEQLTTDN